MPALLAVLSLLGACSGFLDLPDQPRVGVESAAPLQPAAEHGGSSAWGPWHASESRHRSREPAANEPDVRAADAGTSDGPDGGGVEARIGAG